MTREEFIKQGTAMKGWLYFDHFADALEIAGLAPWLAKPEPAPAPPITRERLAAELHSMWVNGPTDPWLAIADRAIELLGQPGSDMRRAFEKSLRAIDALTRERDEARGEVTRLSAQAPPASQAPELDVERLAEAMEAAIVKIWRPVGVTALRPIPEGDEGPKALHEIFRNSVGSEWRWEDSSKETQNARRAQWAEAVRLLRGGER